MPPTRCRTASTGIRFITYVLIGAGFGWFAARNRDSHTRLRLLAERDFLTGIANGRAFDDAVRERLGNGTRFALFIADMDSLKRQGHPEGDRAIRAAARTLVAASRPGDEVACIGGDEFAVLADGLGVADVERLAERMEAETRAAGVPLTVGWAVSPADGEDSVALYRAADASLYARKRLPRKARPAVALVASA